MKGINSSVLSLAIAVSISATAYAAVSVDWVTVGNAGNAPDTSGYGAVSYTYKIARNETTIGQYTEFLNAAAATDSYGLYSVFMADDSGIIRSGTNGNYTYSVIGSVNRPIADVSWFNAARFVNWMHNGQGAGSTEYGVYALNGATSGVYTAQVGATIRLPTEDEWYKAAYYDPAKNAGVGGYWLHANRSDSMTSNMIGVAGAANFIDEYSVSARDRNGLSSNVSDVGAYGLNSQSYYGTNDQAGNVWEWNDAVISGSMRGLRGGSYNDGAPYVTLPSSGRGWANPTEELSDIGFRLVSIPEPTSILLIMFAGGAVLMLRKR